MPCGLGSWVAGVVWPIEQMFICAAFAALDGLRGVAVVAVLLFHDDRLRGGYLGVDLFFVLSGFLITSLLLVEVNEQGRIGLRRFYGRRARRLLPALMLALGMVVVYAAVWAQPHELPRIRWDGIGTLFYFQNWREIFAKRSYWDAFTSPSPLQHAWSLSIEEQFYAIWPLIVIGTVAIRRSAARCWRSAWCWVAPPRRSQLSRRTAVWISDCSTTRRCRVLHLC